MNWNYKRTRFKWQVAKKLFSFGCAFWITETIFFIIKDGWHLKSLSAAETGCDHVASGMISFSLLMACIVVSDFLDFFLHDKD